ncbi:putative restriction endonuclease [Enterobacter sp. SORGH_AS 287]|nr:putative restriction endonuclease [Enterobacter sp. SORGH_AS_0287]
MPDDTFIQRYPPFPVTQGGMRFAPLVTIGLDENMRVQDSEAVNGSGIVGRLFWDFQGKVISLPQVKAHYPQEGFVDWHRREVFKR